MTEVFIGQVMLTGFGFAPRHFAACDGQLLPIAQNQALFALLGIQYGGNGTTTFALPDLRGRTPMGFSSTQAIGVVGGQETVTLSEQQAPTHTHGFAGSTAAADSPFPVDKVFAKAGDKLYASPGTQVGLSAQTVNPGPGAQPHGNMQPYRAVNFCIALQGIFPSRD